MSFRYRVRKMGAGTTPYTTRPDLGPPLTEREIIDEIVQATSLTEGDIRSVLISIGRSLVTAARTGRPSESLFGLFRMGLSSGGSLVDPEQPVDVVELHPSLNLYPAAELQRGFLSGLTFERTGIDAERVPDIELVRNEANGQLDTYTPADALRIIGDDLKIDTADATQGVFLKPAAGPEVRLTRYLTNTSSALLTLVPASVSGPQTLLVRVRFGENLRQTVYGQTVTQAV